MTINNDTKNKDQAIQNPASTTLDSMDLNQIKLRETCAAGEGWMAEVKKDQTLRIIDTEGNQAVDGRKVVALQGVVGAVSGDTPAAQTDRESKRETVFGARRDFFQPLAFR